MILIGTFVLGSAIRWIQACYTPLPEPVIQAQWVPSVEPDSDQRPEKMEAPAKEISKKSDIIEINSATHEDLTSIPGIGPVLADRIIQYRENQGRFRSIEDLKNIKGIGQKKFDNLKKHFVIQQ